VREYGASRDIEFEDYYIYIYSPKLVATRDSLLTKASLLCSRASDYSDHLLARCSLVLSPSLSLLPHALFLLAFSSLDAFSLTSCRCKLLFDNFR